MKLERVADRQHFFVIASRAMRQVLADHARRINRDERGGDRPRVTLDERASASSTAGIDFVDLDDSLSRLSVLHERHAKVVELRLLGGLTIEEAAEALGVWHGTGRSRLVHREVVAADGAANGGVGGSLGPSRTFVWRTDSIR